MDKTLGVQLKKKTWTQDSKGPKLAREQRATKCHTFEAPENPSKNPEKQKETREDPAQLKLKDMCYQLGQIREEEWEKATSIGEGMVVSGKYKR